MSPRQTRNGIAPPFEAMARHFGSDCSCKESCPCSRLARLESGSHHLHRDPDAPQVQPLSPTGSLASALSSRLVSSQDPDLAVRAAVVEATVTVAANLEALSGSPAPGDAPSNPLLRDVFDGLTDTNPAVQHTAAACLVQVI